MLQPTGAGSGRINTPDTTNTAQQSQIRQLCARQWTPIRPLYVRQWTHRRKGMSIRVSWPVKRYQKAATKLYSAQQTAGNMRNHGVGWGVNNVSGHGQRWCLQKTQTDITSSSFGTNTMQCIPRVRYSARRQRGPVSAVKPVQLN